MTEYTMKPTNPNWYYTLLANPLVTVEVGIQTVQARAAVAKGSERTRLYNKMAEMMPFFDEYRHKTTRQIPVIVLTPLVLPSGEMFTFCATSSLP